MSTGQCPNDCCHSTARQPRPSWVIINFFLLPFPDGGHRARSYCQLGQKRIVDCWEQTNAPPPKKEKYLFSRRLPGAQKRLGHLLCHVHTVVSIIIRSNLFISFFADAAEIIEHSPQRGCGVHLEIRAVRPVGRSYPLGIRQGPDTQRTTFEVILYYYSLQRDRPRG